MNYEAYLVVAPDTRIMEWSNGEAITYMPPVDRHQNVSRFLSTLLDAFISFLGWGLLRYAPFEVKLWPDGPAREPDIFLVSRERSSQLTSKRFEGAPDLVIELISPSSVTEDRVHKFTEYEQAGVREYWLIDPRPYQQQADFFVLDEGVFRPAPVDEDGTYHSAVLPGFWLDLAWLWQEDLPNPQLALAEIMLTLDDLPAGARDTYRALRDLLRSRA